MIDNTFVVGIIATLLVGFATLAFLGAANRVASTKLRMASPKRRRDLLLISVTRQPVTLPRNEFTARDGIYGIAWERHNATIGEIVAVDRKTVTRRLVSVKQPRAAGFKVYWNGWVHRGDPESALGLAFEEVHIPGPLGPLPGWLVPGRRTT